MAVAFPPGRSTPRFRRGHFPYFIVHDDQLGTAFCVLVRGRQTRRLERDALQPRRDEHVLRQRWNLVSLPEIVN